jgi:glutaminyl-peptide cyclotransferase
MKKTLIAAIILAAIILISGIAILLHNKPDDSTPTNYSYMIINIYPHDTNAFTEGLVFQNGYLYESTGPYQTSYSGLRKEDLKTGTILQEYISPSQYFDEGITIINNHVIQLTWKNHIGFIYDQDTLKPIQNFTYPIEGWGITNDGSQLIMSDGTQTLYFINSTSFQQTRTIQTHDQNGPVKNLNELEYINGQIYANIWQTNKIAIINPQNGQITAYIDLTGIENIPVNSPDIVLNGIAYNPQNDTLLVTGKMWPRLFEIKTVQIPT